MINGDAKSAGLASGPITPSAIAVTAKVFSDPVSFRIAIISSMILPSVEEEAEGLLSVHVVGEQLVGEEVVEVD